MQSTHSEYGSPYLATRHFNIKKKKNDRVKTGVGHFPHISTLLLVGDGEILYMKYFNSARIH